MRTIFTSMALLCLVFSYAQTIPTSRYTDWALAGVEGGIPCITDENKIFNILDYGGDHLGSTDNYAAWQAALAAADNSGESPRVIYFPEGEYLMNSSIRVPGNTIVKGAGWEMTHLVFDLGGASQPCFDTPIWSWGSYVDVVSGYTKGSTAIIVTDGSQFTVGEWIEIEEDNNPTLMYTDPAWNVSYAQYAKGQFMKVIAINENTITFDRPLKTDYNSNQHIRARRGRLNENIGFENFKITRPNTGDSYFFYLKNTANVWIRGVYGWRTNKAFVQTERAVNYEVRGCYFERAYDYGGGGHGYGVSVGYHSCDGLIENNIFNRLRHHMIIAKGASGNVFAYNYSFDRVQGTDTNNLNHGWIPPDISIHGHWSYMNLFEGNISQEAHSADFWGPSGPGTTFFRNRLEAAEGIYLDDASVDQNVVGNELLLGDIVEDPTVTGTFMHGNNVQGTISWNVGSGSNNLMDSYYLSVKPDWWGNQSWPTIGPEFEIGEGTIPAKTRWEAGERALNYTCIIDCHGDLHGTAEEDECGTCAGGNTGVVPVTNSEECIATALEGGQTSWLKVYPNPSQGSIKVEAAGSHTLQVSTPSGEVVLQKTFTHQVILEEELRQGFYFLEVDGEVVKVVKQ